MSLSKPGSTPPQLLSRPRGHTQLLLQSHSHSVSALTGRICQARAADTGGVTLQSCGPHLQFLCVLWTSQILKWARTFKGPCERLTSTSSAKGTQASTRMVRWTRTGWQLGCSAGRRSKPNVQEGTKNKRERNRLLLQGVFFSIDVLKLSK